MPPKETRTYIRVHDSMPDHPKVEGLSDKAFRLMVTCWCWCAKHETNGKIRESSWVQKGSAAARRELIEVGLADVIDDGVQMHDFLDWQRSKEHIDAIRVKRAAAGARGGRPPKATGKQIGFGLPSKSESKNNPETEELLRNSQTETELSLGTTSRGERQAPLRAVGGTSPQRCAQHLNVPAGEPGPNCRNCQRLREQREADAELTDAAASLTSRMAIDKCDLCDDNGIFVGDDDKARRCTHQTRTAS